MKREKGWDAIDTITILIYGYTDNFTLLYVYIECGVKSSDAKVTGW